MKKTTLFAFCLVGMLLLSACGEKTPIASDATAGDTNTPVDVSETGTQEEVKSSVPRLVYTNYSSAFVTEGVDVSAEYADLDLDMVGIGQSIDRKMGNRSFELNGETVTLTYGNSTEYQKSTVEEICAQYSKDNFLDENGNKFSFGKDSDTLLRYTNVEMIGNDYVDSGRPLDEAGLIAKAQEILNRYVNVQDVSVFSRDVTKRDNYTSVVYRYSLCGYDTECTVHITLTNSGKLRTYDAHNVALFEAWQDQITAEDVQRAAEVISFPSTAGIAYTDEKLVIGNDGYLYLQYNAATQTYDVTDENGTVLVPSTVDEYVYYIRVVPD